MKSLFQLKYLLILLIGGCLTPWRLDKLVYYKSGYNPNYDSSIKINGFYYFKDTNSFIRRDFLGDNIKNIDPVIPCFFYADGSFFQGAIYPSLDSLKKWIPKEVYGRSSKWGFYKKQNDTLFIEHVQADFSGQQNAIRTEIRGIIKNNSTIIFTNFIDKSKNQFKTNDTLYFEPFTWKPDSTRNWLKKHWRYKIE